MLAIFLQMKKLMEICFHVDDGDEVWRKLAEEAEQEGKTIVTVNMTVNNVDRVNK